MPFNPLRWISGLRATGSDTTQKVFAIGSNKTGTTSLKEALRLMGLHVAPQYPAELLAERAWRGDLRPLARFIRRYDAFKDVPFSNRDVYARVDSLFPGSKFILTIREPESWFNSISRYHAKLMGFDDPGQITPEAMRAFTYCYPGYWAHNAEVNWLQRPTGAGGNATDWSLLYDKDHYIRTYQDRNDAIIRHFDGRPDDLLVIDVTRETDTARLADFLGRRGSPNVHMPWLNAT